MRKLFSFVSFLLAFSFVLSACGQPAATPVATETIVSTFTAVPTATKAPPTKTPKPLPTFTATATPEALQQSVFEVKAGRYQEIGSKIGNSYAYVAETGDLLTIKKGTSLMVTAPKGGLTVNMVVLAENDLKKVAQYAQAAYPEANSQFYATFQFDGVPTGWQNANLPDGWEYYFVPSQLGKRTDYTQDAVENARNGVPQWSYLQVTCEKYQSDPGNLPEGIRWNQRHIYQVLVLNVTPDLKKVCGNRANGVASVWANVFGFNANAVSKTPAAYRQLMADALSMYFSPFTKNDEVVLRGGQVVPLMNKLLDGATNYARFVVGAEMNGWAKAPVEWSAK